MAPGTAKVPDEGKPGPVNNANFSETASLSVSRFERLGDAAPIVPGELQPVNDNGGVTLPVERAGECAQLFRILGRPEHLAPGKKPGEAAGRELADLIPRKCREGENNIGPRAGMPCY